MKKRILSLLLTTAMVAGLLSGCGGNGEGKEEESDNPGTVDDGEDEQELTTVRILCKNDMSDTVKTEDWEQYPVSQVFIEELEEIGIRLELECISNESVENVFTTRMASGQNMPDLIAYCWIGNGEQDVLEWAESGLVYPVNELLDQYDEDGSIKAFYDEMAPGTWEGSTAADGNVYWFSYLAGDGTTIDRETGEEYQKVAPYTLSIRKDWVEAVGEEVQEVYTPDELFDILKKMHDEDANGNGVSDEIAYLAIDWFNYTSQPFGLNPGLICETSYGGEEVTSNFYNENFPTYIEFMQRLYENGLIDSTILNTSQEQLISDDRLSVVFGYSEWDYEYLIPDREEDEMYVPILLDADGDLTNGFPIRIDFPYPVAYNQYFVPSSCENPEAVVRLMDYVYTEEYALLNQFGVEGLAYEFDENGNIVTLPEDGNNGVSLYETSLGLYALPRMSLYPSVADRCNEAASSYMQEKQLWVYNFSRELYPMADPVYPGVSLAPPTEEERAVISETSGQLTSYVLELHADLVLGNRSLDDLPQYLEELESLGLQEYIDVTQARYDRYWSGTSNGE